MSLGSKDPESQVYLFGLMDKLEQVRAVPAHVADWMWGGDDTADLTREPLYRPKPST